MAPSTPAQLSPVPQADALVQVISPDGALGGGCVMSDGAGVVMGDWQRLALQTLPPVQPQSWQQAALVSLPSQTPSPQVPVLSPPPPQPPRARMMQSSIAVLRMGSP